ncbi:MAG TPA: methylmalonyl-CoA mutase family protein, partial [Cyclobacteriaceae bacterium]|nr:methylmalonyl-CoA mutase family protein [Cyclobacteriaceae bacterium]
RGLSIASNLFIHAASLPWKATQFEPHENMIKGTSAAMASILGGCDALTIDAEDNTQPMQLRVARNVSNILREDSFFSKVADPVAGSYYIEDLTRQISEGAWKSVQQS